MNGPIVFMTPFEYWIKWIVFWLLAILVARILLINPLLAKLEAIRKLLSGS